MRVYYIADSKTRTRLTPVHKTLEAAQCKCERMNKLEPGRYQVGDWCDLKEVGVDHPHQWLWRSY